MNRRVLIGVAALVVGLFLIAFCASPVFAVRGIIGAAKAGDEAALSQRVDFPAFRDSLKDELNARLVAEMRADPRARDSALGGLSLMLAPALVSGAVDALVTPRTIVAMVETAEAPDPMDREPEPPASGRDRDIQRNYGYRGLNSFAVTLTDPDRPDEPIDLLLERRGLFGWKLAGVDLPERPAD